WGRASGAFSILTVRAGRPTLPASVWGRPVSGATGGWVVVVRIVVEVVVRRTATFFEPPLQDATATAASSTATGAPTPRPRARPITARGARRCARRGAGGCRTSGRAKPAGPPPARGAR